MGSCARLVPRRYVAPLSRKHAADTFEEALDDLGDKVESALDAVEEFVESKAEAVEDFVESKLEQMKKDL